MTSTEVEEIKRHFSVVAEGLRSDVRLVVEGLAANTERLERVETRLDGVEVRLDALETTVGAVRSELGGLKSLILPLVPRSDN